MKILGIMGSPHPKGFCYQFTDSFLKGAASKGAEVKQLQLIKHNIKYCRGCYKCVHNNQELPIGICPLKDDMAGILQEYHQADGYIMATPVYDFTVTAVMKTFIERRFALYFKNKSEPGIPAARVKHNYKKKASIIVTGSASDDYAPIAEPCYEVIGGHFMIEEIEVVDQCYIGSVHNLDEEHYGAKLDETFSLGVRLVEEIEKARQEDE